MGQLISQQCWSQNLRDSATASAEGWLGDGSAQTPYIIDGLDIDRGGGWDDCISISNTRVNFTISNCRIINAGGPPSSIPAGIRLRNVMNGKLLENIFDSNSIGIFLDSSNSNTVANNTCNNNSDGIRLEYSHSNTVANNTCTRDGAGWGILLSESNSNTVANNTCTTYYGILLS
ncbi:MAG: NosD domain-containing protein [Candidatus Thorarchaeota archaeon]|jgi:parallel beta-helix repeat protein